MEIELNVKYGLVYASFLHDLGKISQRIGERSKYNNDEKMKSLLTKGYGYLHSLFTQEFFDREINGKSIELIFKVFGSPFPNGEEEDNITNLSARHHNPNSAYQWLIAKSDRLSAGHDRKKSDEEDELTGKKFLKTRTESIFNLIDIGKAKPSSKFYYEINSFDGNSKISKFPIKQADLKPKYDELLNEQYKKLYKEFCNKFDSEVFPELEKNPFREETLYKFLTLSERYYFSVPSSTIDLPDINLYDHSYLIAAISVALYDYHKTTNSFSIKEIQNDESEKFTIIQGDLSGIQSYILKFKQEAKKGLAKTLRARSFYLQMISKSIEKEILNKLELPPTSVILSAGSKFQILGPNLPKVKNLIEELQLKIDSWLLEKYMGDISFHLATINLSPKDLLSDDKKSIPLGNKLKELHKILEQKKSEKLKSVLIKDGVWNANNFIFHNQYKDYLENEVCSVQGSYPATEIDKESKENGKRTIGELALREKEIGQLIPNSDYIKFEDKGIGELPFGNFSVSNKGFYRLIQNDKTLEPSFSFIGHLPKFKDKSDKTRKEYYDKFCFSCNENKPEGCSIQAEFQNKSFHCLAQESLRKNPHDEEMIGKSFLGVLKADVDNLGLIFQKGLSKNQNRDKDYFSISRYSGLSKNINYFFTEYLSEILVEKFPDIYTVYAGGDDLFLLGPFPIVLKFAKFYQEEFRSYTCENPNISFSAGFALQKPRAPISIGAGRAEEELENAKQTKNSISVFGNSLSWNEFSKCLEITESLKTYIDSEILSTGQMYRLLKYIRMYKNINQNPMNVMYNSYFVYDKRRNIYAKISEQGNKEKDLKYKNLAKDLEDYFSKDFENRKILDFLEVPIQLAIYQSRGGKG